LTSNFLDTPPLNKVAYRYMEKISVNVDSYFFPHVRLLKMAENLLDHANALKQEQDRLQEQDKKGLLPPQIGTFVDDVIRCPVDEFLVPSFLVLVFSFEAFINTIGEFVIDDFTEEFDNKSNKQKRKSIKDKTKAIYEKLGIYCDCGKPPFQTILESFNYRDAWVHAKACENKKECEYTDETEASRAFWEGHKVNCEENITIKYVEELYGYVKSVIKQIKNNITSEKLSEKHKNDINYLLLDGKKSAQMR